MSAPGDGLSKHEMAADAFELQYAWVLLHRARPKSPWSLSPLSACTRRRLTHCHVKTNFARLNRSPIHRRRPLAGAQIIPKRSVRGKNKK